MDMDSLGYIYKLLSQIKREDNQIIHKNVGLKIILDLSCISRDIGSGWVMRSSDVYL